MVDSKLILIPNDVNVLILSIQLFFRTFIYEKGSSRSKIFWRGFSLSGGFYR